MIKFLALDKPNYDVFIHGAMLHLGTMGKYISILRATSVLREKAQDTNRCGRSLYPTVNRKLKLNRKHKLLLFVM